MNLLILFQAFTLWVICCLLKALDAFYDALMIRLKIKEIAREKKISQSRLARLADVDNGTMRKAYHNENITLETLNKIARALQMHPAELFEYEPDPPPAL